MSTNQVILHLSDLHFSSEPSRQEEKEYIMDSLIRQLASLEPQWKPTIVCISGDIVDKCDTKAYPIAEKQLMEISEVLKIPRENFLFTPGNHDCIRTNNPIVSDANKLGTVIDKELRERFKDYEEFCTKFGSAYIWNHQKDALIGYRIVNDLLFWGCNTEWFACEDHSKLLLGKGVMNHFQRMIPNEKDYIIIALMHHGVEVEFAESETQYHNDICPALHHLWRFAHMALYGHSHEQIGGEPNIMENHCYCIRAGAASMNQDYPNNVNLIAIHDHAFELRCIKYVPSEVEQPWKVESNAKEYFWMGKENKNEKLLAIRGLLENTEDMERRADAFLDLTPYFKEKHLVETYSWRKINELLMTFLSGHTSVGKWYALELVAGYTVAFMMGRILNPKSGKCVRPMQRTVGGLLRWHMNDGTDVEGALFQKEEFSGENDSTNMLLLVSVCADVSEEAIQYCDKKGIRWKKAYHFRMVKLRNDSVVSGHHAWTLAQQINEVLEERTLEQKRGTLHIFYAGPWGIIYNLGMLSLSYGKVQLYEHDMKKDIEMERYYPTVHYPLEGES